FIPLDSRVRFSIQSKVEGLMNESSRLIAGVLIFSFAFVPFFKVEHILVLLLVLVGLYFIFINRLYHGYRSKIREKLEAGDEQQVKLERGFAQVMGKLEQNLAAP